MALVLEQFLNLEYIFLALTRGGHSITKHMGDWLEELSQKPENIYTKIAVFKKCENHTYFPKYS